MQEMSDPLIQKSGLRRVLKPLTLYSGNARSMKFNKERDIPLEREFLYCIL